MNLGISVVVLGLTALSFVALLKLRLHRSRQSRPFFSLLPHYSNPPEAPALSYSSRSLLRSGHRRVARAAIDLVCRRPCAQAELPWSLLRWLPAAKEGPSCNCLLTARLYLQLLRTKRPWGIRGFGNWRWLDLPQRWRMFANRCRQWENLEGLLLGRF